MFLKFALFSTLITLLLSVYIRQYHLPLYNQLSNFETTDLQDTLITWFNFLDIYPKRNVQEETKQSSSSSTQKVKLFTKDELAEYTGKDGSKGLCLAILGKVYDVGSGMKHYGPGGGYNFFTGRDGSRAFVTGEFTEEGLSDDVIDLTPKDVKSILQWQEFYEKDYKYVGNLIGRYFDPEGKKTAYHREVEKMVDDATREEEEESDLKVLYPPCNSEWSHDAGGRVWCSKMSGGIERDWIGVPRQLYEPGSDTPRCACVKSTSSETSDVNLAQLKEYPECDSKAESCKITA